MLLNDVIRLLIMLLFLLARRNIDNNPIPFPRVSSGAVDKSFDELPRERIGTLIRHSSSSCLLFLSLWIMSISLFV